MRALILAAALAAVVSASASVQDEELSEIERIAIGQVATNFKAMTVEQQVATLDLLREILDDRLLKPDRGDLQQHAQTLDDPDVHVNRVLERERFDGYTLHRGGGAYFSFTASVNDYNREPDLGLQQWGFSSGFYGSNFGIVRRLATSLQDLKLETVPEDLLEPDPNALPDRTPMVPAVVGATYVVRSVRWKESDVLAAFQVLERDEYGVTFAWKLLKTFEFPIR